MRYMLARIWRRIGRSWIVRLTVSPILSGIIATIALRYYSSDQLKHSITHSWPVIAGLMNAKAFLVFCIAAAWTPCVSAVRNWLDENSKACLDVEAPIAHYLLNCIDDVVGYKAIRFRKTFESLQRGGNASDPDEVFTRITQPQAQIEQLAQAVLTFFNCMNSDSSNRLRVSLVSVRDGLPETFVAFFPRNVGPRSTISQLRHPESAMCVAASRRKIHIVSDIRKEGNKSNGKKQFRITESSRSDEDGSMFCYPIMHPIRNECAMVISVCSSTSGYFRKDRKHLYEFAMQRFEQRIQLEYTLGLLKEHRDGECSDA